MVEIYDELNQVGANKILGVKTHRIRKNSIPISKDQRTGVVNSQKQKTPYRSLTMTNNENNELQSYPKIAAKIQKPNQRILKEIPYHTIQR